MRNVVGIDRKIKRIWLDSALDHLGLKSDDTDLRSFMNEQLQEELPGKESRAKALGIILRVWSTIPPERVHLRDRAIELLHQISGHDRVWLHWGMTALAYPFFRDTAEVVGRLLALQDDFTTAHVQDRIVAAWGDRVTSKLAARYLLNTLVDWDLLRSTKSQGHFLLAKKLTSGSDLQLWLLEALLAASASDEIEAQQLLRLPEAFPFSITIGVADLRNRESLVIHRQGLDMDMIGLAKLPTRPDVQPSSKANKIDASGKETTQPGKKKSVASDRHDKPSSTLSATSKTAKRNSRDNRKLDRRKIEALLKTEYLSTIGDRVDRDLQVRSDFVSNGPFADAIKECAKLYRDGHFAGCIALSQLTLESLVLYIRKNASPKSKTHNVSFEENVESLRKKETICDEMRNKLIAMWVMRLSHLLLLKPIEEAHPSLECQAKGAIALLVELASINNATTEK